MVDSDLSSKKGKDLYEFLNDNCNGSLSELNDFAIEDVTHLCKLGFLTRGKDGQNEKRYKLTSLGKKQVRIVCAQNRVENALDTILEILP